MLEIQQVTGGYSDLEVLHDLSFSVEKGEMFGILGPNGSGKTTLLKMISGLLSPRQGEILLQNRSLAHFPKKELAKKLAVLPQIQPTAFAYTVKEIVSLGRYAHQKGLFQVTREEDEQMINKAMRATGVYSFQHKLVNTLSGGEQQRVFLAQALTQNPEILLLDEPTNHLDLAFQKELLDQLKQWVLEKGLTCISTFHDLNIASLYCDRLLLLNKGKVHAIGRVDDVIQKHSIQAVYQTEVEMQMHPKVPKPQMALLPKEWGSKDKMVVDELDVQFTEGRLLIETPIPVKAIGSDGSMGWRSRFTASEDLSPELLQYGTYQKFFIVTWTNPEKSSFHHYLFVNGILTDEGFVRTVIVLSEIKTLLLGKSEGSFTVAAMQSGNRVNLNELRVTIQQAIKQQLNTLRQIPD